MTPRTGRMIVITLLTCLALPAWGQQYLLYAPQRLPSGQKTSTQEGILVQEIEVQKGDTLYALSLKFGGRGMYYPQILLFNKVNNPNLIYPGNILRIPVPQKEANDSARIHSGPTGTSLQTKASGDKIKHVKAEAAPSGSHRIKKRTAAHVKRKPSQGSPSSASTISSPLPGAHGSTATTAPAAGSAASQKLFEAAVKAYRKDDCQTALELLDRYLADNSGSLLAADANLYKADCYLKLSAQ